MAWTTRQLPEQKEHTFLLAILIRFLPVIVLVMNEYDQTHSYCACAAAAAAAGGGGGGVK